MTYPNPHAPGCPWYPITESQGAPNLKWCEETLCQIVSEPANTWSNLGYLFFGVLITVLAIRKKESSELKQFGPIVFFMGAMSLFYHMSNFYGSQILDFVGMFFFVGWAKGMNLIRLGKLSRKNLLAFNLTLASLSTLVLHGMYLAGLKYQMLILISGFIIIATEVLAQRKFSTDKNWFFVSMGLLSIAFAFSVSDVKRFWCQPENHGWFSQGHALWHWAASMAMFTIYMHYSQEKLKSFFKS